MVGARQDTPPCTCNKFLTNAAMFMPSYKQGLSVINSIIILKMQFEAGHATLESNFVSFFSDPSRMQRKYQ